MTAAAPVAPTGPLTIDGRAFIVVEDADAQHDIYLTRELRAAGLLPDPSRLLSADASDDDNAFAMVCAVYDSGRTFTLLAGLLTEAGTEWTPQQAARNAVLFAGVRDRDSKQVLQGVLAAGIAGFFDAGRAGLARFRSSSRPTTVTTVTPAPVPDFDANGVRTTAPAAHPPTSAAPTSGSGTTSSARSSARPAASARNSSAGASPTS